MAEDDSRTLNVLFVDDEADNLDAFVFNCEEFWNTHTVLYTQDVMAGGYDVKQHDAVIVDLVFGYPQDLSADEKVDPRQGLALLDWLQKHHPDLPCMVLSAYLTEDIKQKINEKHPRVLCMRKPMDFSTAGFREMIEKFIREYKG
jgi:hypothetical protein